MHVQVNFFAHYVVQFLSHGENPYWWHLQDTEVTCTVNSYQITENPIFSYSTIATTQGKVPTILCRFYVQTYCYNINVLQCTVVQIRISFCQIVCILTARTPKVCDLDCHNGTCQMVNDVPTCKCQSLYSGDRCQNYRCSQYCKNKGLCFADLLATLPGDSSPPLKVILRNMPCIIALTQED